jgi:hypothetical protein
MENQLNAIVTQIIQVSPAMKIFRIAPDSWELPDFISGQFAALALPASAPRVEDATPDPEVFEPDKTSLFCCFIFKIKRVY